MERLPAINNRSGTSDAGSPPFAEPSAFQRELERARRHLARLEAEQQLRAEHPILLDETRFDESPALVKTCNVLIWAIVLLPVVVAVIALVRRMAA